ncbi:hypothetical protein GJ496_007407 [Pomphorhynchus laevis]|nr:hypothetical protein GJ496_007407 [Pomphorhynchus laevis]
MESKEISIESGKVDRALTLLNLIAIDLTEVARKVLCCEPYYLQRCKSHKYKSYDPAFSENEVKNHGQLRNLRTLSNMELKQFCYNVPCLLKTINTNLLSNVNIIPIPNSDPKELAELRQKLEAFEETIKQQTDKIDLNDYYQERLLKIMELFHTIASKKKTSSTQWISSPITYLHISNILLSIILSLLISLLKMFGRTNKTGQIRDRYFHNNYRDYNPSDSGQLAQYQNKLNEKISAFILSSSSQISLDANDYTVYTGSAGIVYAYLLLSNKLNCPELTDKFNNLRDLFLKNVDIAKDAKKTRRITMLCGDPGIYVIEYLLNPTEAKLIDIIHYFRNLLPLTLDSSKFSDELLYGRAGYLQAVLFLRKTLIIKNDLQHIAEIDLIIKELAESILKNGRKNRYNSRSQLPLCFKWHDKMYFGAAHGLSGILLMLIKATECVQELKPHINSYILPAVKSLIDHTFDTGNLKSSEGNETDRLVQWCHGSPGLIPLLVEAYRISDDAYFIEKATWMANDVWKRGLLQKGYGLCHGAAGNAYAFLYLYKVTNDQLYLYRSLKFAEYCITKNTREISRVPDRPNSLFEGKSGTLYFLADVLDLQNSGFPFYCDNISN